MPKTKKGGRLGIRGERSGFGKGAAYTWSLPAAMLAKNPHARQQEKVANMDKFGEHGAQVLPSDAATGHLETTNGEVV